MLHDFSVPNGTSRRRLLARGLAASGLAAGALASAGGLAVTLPSAAQAAPTPPSVGNGTHMVTVKDGTRIFFKDWGPADRSRSLTAGR